MAAATSSAVPVPPERHDGVVARLALGRMHGRHGRVDRAGRDAVHGDAARRQLPRHRLRERLHPRLRRGVGGARDNAAGAGGQRRQRHDPPSVGEAPLGGAAAQEHADEIDRQNLVPPLGRERGQRPGVRDPRGDHDPVEARGVRWRLREGSIDGRAVDHIHLDRSTAARAGDAVRSLVVPVHDDDLIPLLREPARRRRADAAGAATTMIVRAIMPEPFASLVKTLKRPSHDDATASLKVACTHSPQAASFDHRRAGRL